MAITIDEARAHIGDGVVYQPVCGDVDEGTITSVGDRWVFVRYGGCRMSRATDPADLTLLAPGTVPRDRRQEEYERYAYGKPGIRL